jgi:hypothetical protein
MGPGCRGGGGAEGAKALAGVLTGNNTITELTLGGGVGGEGVEALFTARMVRGKGWCEVLWCCVHNGVDGEWCGGGGGEGVRCREGVRVC